MKKNLTLAAIVLISLSARAADRYFVTGQAVQTIPTVIGNHSCDIPENSEIINNAVINLQSNARLDALTNCGVFNLTGHIPHVVLNGDYKTTFACKAFGMRIEIKVAGVFECLP